MNWARITDPTVVNDQDGGHLGSHATGRGRSMPIPARNGEGAGRLFSTLLKAGPAVVERLDRIWPGPGEAPQAYAW